MGYQPKATETQYSSKRSARAERRRPFSSRGNARGGGLAGGRLKPEIKVTVGGDIPPSLGVDFVTFEDLREFLLAYSEYEQHMHIINQDGGDRVLARRRELVDTATLMMVADEFYDGKPWVDLSEAELMRGLERFAGIDLQSTSDEDFCREIFRVLKRDASVSVDRKGFMQSRALRKKIADIGLTEVVKPDSRKYTIKHGKVLVEVMVGGIEPPRGEKEDAFQSRNA